MPELTVVLALLALLGHAALWVGFVNRVHATAAPRGVVKVFSTGGHALLAVLPLVAAGRWWYSGESPLDWLSACGQNNLVRLYLVPCWLIGAVILLVWTNRRFFTPVPAALRSRRTTVVDIAKIVGHKPLFGFKAQLLSLVPSNQVLKLAVEELELQFARLPEQLDGFYIVHLSDLHFTGRIGVEYFQEMLRQANSLQPNLIVITGDIVDEL